VQSYFPIPSINKMSWICPCIVLLTLVACGVQQQANGHDSAISNYQQKARIWYPKGFHIHPRTESKKEHFVSAEPVSSTSRPRIADTPQVSNRTHYNDKNKTRATPSAATASVLRTTATIRPSSGGPLLLSFEIVGDLGSRLTDPDKKLVVEVGVNDLSMLNDEALGLRNRTDVVVLGFEPLLDKYARNVLKYRNSGGNLDHGHHADSTSIKNEVEESRSNSKEDENDSTTWPNDHIESHDDAAPLRLSLVDDLWSEEGRTLFLPFAVGDDTQDHDTSTATTTPGEDRNIVVENAGKIYTSEDTEATTMKMMPEAEFYVAKLDGC
ncbi:unnamed protein product, partial [Amoebophrya sp. A25]